MWVVSGWIDRVDVARICVDRFSVYRVAFEVVVMT